MKTKAILVALSALMVFGGASPVWAHDKHKYRKNWSYDRHYDREVTVVRRYDDRYGYRRDRYYVPERRVIQVPFLPTIVISR